MLKLIKTDLSAIATGRQIRASINTSQKEAMVSLILILRQNGISKLVAVMNLEPLKPLQTLKHQDQNLLVNGLSGLHGAIVQPDVVMANKLVSEPVQMTVAKDLQLNLLRALWVTVSAGHYGLNGPIVQKNVMKKVMVLVKRLDFVSMGMLVIWDVMIRLLLR